MIPNHAIIGTAGHIDHGKTALIKALTGVDVDTLAEEKRRGITIELGFAFMDAPGTGKEILFIDVPGHERLIKTMVAGASNLDAVLLVIAADEGVEQQTHEHFEILRLLEIPRGAIALTKADLVDEARIGAVTAQVRKMARGSFLEDARVVPVSAVTGQGIDELKAALVEVARSTRPRTDSGIFRMPIDRVFTMHGFGTVVAGTILSGKVRVGDKLEVLPEGLVSRVRGIQVHAKSIEDSGIGVRTAINLQDIKKEDLRRGQVAVAPGSLKPTDRMDVRLHLLVSAPEALRQAQDAALRSRTRVRLHVGADEVMARVILLRGDRLEPGSDALVQLSLESPTVALAKDRFVIRTFSSMETVGGGVIVDAHAAPHRRHDSDVLEALEKRLGELADALEQVFAKSGAIPLTAAHAAAALSESEDDALRAVDELREAGRIVPAGDAYLSAGHYAQLEKGLIGILEEFYARNPYRLYMPSADLQSRFGKLASKTVYEAIVADMVADGRLVIADSRIGIAGKQPRWRVGERDTADRIECIYDEAGLSTKIEEEVQHDMRLDDRTFANMMTALIDQNRLVRLGENVTYTTNHLEEAKRLVVENIKAKGGITAPELRDLLGLSRKYAIAILEYLDNAQVTRRLGDKRVLR